MKSPQLPAPELATALSLTNMVWLKREDKHHYGSHKGHSIPFMIQEYVKLGKNNFVISSSGNAALASILTIISLNKNKPQTPITLQVFIGQEISKIKQSKLTIAAALDSKIAITQEKNPKQSALQFEKEHHAQLLRQSTDALALIGYAELANELSRIPDLSAIFIPTSSGTTAEGLHLGFKALGLNPEIHVVQTSSCHPIVEEFYTATKRPLPAFVKEKSTADAIVDLIGYRKQAVAKAITESHGDAWIASNTAIAEAVELVKEKTKTDISSTSALAIAGLKQAVATGRTWTGAVVCLITGA
jgi:threonine synthase